MNELFFIVAIVVAAAVAAVDLCRVGVAFFWRVGHVASRSNILDIYYFRECFCSSGKLWSNQGEGTGCCWAQGGPSSFVALSRQIGLYDQNA